MREADRALESLWASLFGEPPSIAAEPALLVRVLVQALPCAPPYRPAEPASRACFMQDVYPEEPGR